MKKCKIRVFDYTDAFHGGDLSQYDINNPPEVIHYDVEAYCVDGPEGVMAFFIMGGSVWEARGDDGHWWLVSVCGSAWWREGIEALQAMFKDSLAKEK